MLPNLKLHRNNFQMRTKQKRKSDKQHGSSTGTPDAMPLSTLDLPRSVEERGA